MAAISSTLMSVLGAGGHLLAQNCLYGGTYDLLTKDFPELLDHEVDLMDVDTSRLSWRELIRSDTRALYVESISNPLLEFWDLEGRWWISHDAQWARIDS